MRVSILDVLNSTNKMKNGTTRPWVKIPRIFFAHDFPEHFLVEFSSLLNPKFQSILNPKFQSLLNPKF